MKPKACHHPIRRFCRAILVMVVAATGASVEAEHIVSFHSQIEVRINDSLLVTETIQVRAQGKQIKRGIYRDFPQLYRGKWSLNQRTGFSVREVQRDGKPESFHVEQRSNGVRVYIGSPSVVLPPATYTYRLTYETDRQLGFFPDHDELYWNVTGNGWDFVIEKATAEVILPPGVEATKVVAYTGLSGARGRDFTAEREGGRARFATTRMLEPVAGLTIVVTWPKGFVTQGDPWARLAAENQGTVLAMAGLLVLLVYYVIVWRAVGRDPKSDPIVPLSSPPSGLSPAALRYLVWKGFDDRAFAATLVSLAVKGFIAIERTDGDTYAIRRSDRDASELPPEEKSILRWIPFDGPLVLQPSASDTICSARLAAVASLKARLGKWSHASNWQYWLPGFLFSFVPLGAALFDAPSPGIGVGFVAFLAMLAVIATATVSRAVICWRRRLWSEAIAMSLFGLILVAGEMVALGLMAHLTSSWTAGLLVAGIFLNGLFLHLLKAPTRAGRAILDQIEGFRMYLAGMDQGAMPVDRSRETTGVFEKYLPYAMALGLEQKWTEQFARVLTAAGEEAAALGREWYSGPPWNSLTASGFGDSLGGSLSTAISSAAMAPGTSSGSSSNSGGGGGSSGGGGGGGGGGGW